MRPIIKRLIYALVVAGFSALPAPSQARSVDLNIRPAIQQTVVWCWAAVSEMVLRYYSVPNLNPGGNFQCGIVGSLGGACWQDCRYCITPIGGTLHMAQILNGYQQIANWQAFRTQPTGRLSFRKIVKEINRGSPVIAGVSPSGLGLFYPGGMSEHVTLIVGYDTESGGWLKVNDPMPYDHIGYDPYIAAGAEPDSMGSYWIRYDAFVNRLGYKDTIVVLQ